MRDKEALRKLPKEHGWNIHYVVAACLRSFGLFVGRDFAKYLGCILKQILCYRHLMSQDLMTGFLSLPTELLQEIGVEVSSVSCSMCPTSNYYFLLYL